MKKLNNYPIINMNKEISHLNSLVIISAIIRKNYNIILLCDVYRL